MEKFIIFVQCLKDMGYNIENLSFQQGVNLEIDFKKLIEDEYPELLSTP